MILLVDNYDSFTWNVYQFLAELGADVRVMRNDDISADEVEQLEPTLIVLSPGPGTPTDAGVCCDLVRTFAGRIPIFGICLGMQCIGEVYGGTVGPAGELVHGKTSAVEHDGTGAFHGLPTPFAAVRYHSLVVQRTTVAPELIITAEASNGLVMGLRHRTLAVEGVQFHPESILTEHGMALFANVLTMQTDLGEAI